MRFLFSLFLTLVLILPAKSLMAWGPTGHRVIGEIAWNHLSKKAQKRVKAVLGDESLAMCSTWMDFIRSNPEMDYTNPWHYCTIPYGKTYAEAGTPEEGDVLWAIDMIMDSLQNGDFPTVEREQEMLRYLVHLIGDLHQPLHVGNGTDRGGNDRKVTYFWEESNLHRVWDSGIIDKQLLSYTEYVAWIDHATKEELSKWQAGTPLDWARESQDLHEAVYDLPEDNRISWRYNYDHIDTVNLRLLQAGLRLAWMLEKVYG